MKKSIVAICLAVLCISSVAVVEAKIQFGSLVAGQLAPIHHAKSSYGLEFWGKTKDMVMDECQRITPVGGTCEYGGFW